MEKYLHLSPKYLDKLEKESAQDCVTTLHIKKFELILFAVFRDISASVSSACFSI